MQKKKMVFDATILAMGAQDNNSRTGIYFVALNLLKQFIDSNKFDIYIYCEKLYAHVVRDAINEMVPNNNLTFLLKPHQYKYGLLTYLRQFKQQANQHKNIIFKNFIQLLCLLIDIELKFEELKYSLKTKVSNINYDIYFSPMHKMPNFIKNNKNIKKYTLLHDVIPLVLEEYKAAIEDKNSWFAQLVESLNPNDYYFANSEYTRKDFLKYCPKINPNKIFTIPLACNKNFDVANREMINIAKVKYKIPLDKKYIFNVSRLDPRKNLVRNIRTFIEFIDQHKITDIVFVVGGGNDKCNERLKKEIGDIYEKYSDKIILTGYIEDEYLPALYSGAEWFVYTSQYEGFGLPPLEAMSCGCPVITSNNSSLPEVVGDAGIMIDWDSDEQHINAYERYYFDEDYRKEIAKKGLERSKEYSWEKCTENIINVIFKEVQYEY